MKNKLVQKSKRLLSGIVATAIAASMLPTLPAVAETGEKYPYTLFAASKEEGAITVNSGNFCVNGNVATNGTIVSSGNMNINGTKTENANESMIFIFDKIDSQYFSTSNVEEFAEDYTLEEINININTPTEVMGETTLTGNININTALKSLEDVNLYGEVKNTNDSVIFSKYGDIIIDSQNVNLNGLVYAPFGDVEVTAQNLNLNNVVIIADSITLNCPNVNANYSGDAAEFVGTVSEPLDIPVDEWQYMKDENENDFPDFFEDMNNWKLLKDTDGDKLPDSIEHYLGSDSTLVDTDGDLLDDYYEVFITRTDPTLIDTDENGITDGNEDFDEDGLNNYEEYVQNTSPWSEDSDSDGLTDGEEVNTYGTNPLEPDTDFDGLEDDDEIYLGTDPTLPDTDGDGVLDCDEKFNQTFTHIVENEDCAIEEVIVSMEGTGNLQKTTSVESMTSKDIMSSDVVGLVGEPFEINSTSHFDIATITFKVDKSKLGNTSFDNLLFLWYDEENQTYVEMETTRDMENGTVSIKTTHFSEYMLVDQQVWFDAWAADLYSEINSHDPTGFDTILVIDCSGSMYYNDSNATGRKAAAEKFIESARSTDRIAILAEDYPPKWLCGFTPLTDKTTLLDTLNKIYSSGGNDFNSSITKSVELFESESKTAHKNIIFMSDGGCNVSDDILKKAKDADITIFTVGFGTSSWDNVLKHMAEYTGGEFYKAITADELVDIYEKIGTEQYLDLTDTDKDNLADIFEQSGIRVQNGQIIHTDYQQKDTDKDGLEDGQEIEPKFEMKVIPQSITGTKQIVGIQFIMNSNPEIGDDSDMDGYSDVDDPYPMDKPDILGDKYDFLDGEIYYLAKMVGYYPEYYMDVKGNSTSPGASLIMYKYNGNGNQKFKFEWCETGYKIHALNNENLVLTLHLNDDGSYSIYMGNDLNLQGQLWEILPYNNGAEGLLSENGLVIRSKVLYYEDDDTTGQSLYLNYENNQISVSTDRINNTRFMTCAITDWTRFGDAYMQYVGWTYDSDAKINRAMVNYSINNSIGLSSDNIINYNGLDLILNQAGGNFPRLNYASVTMNESICEVIAT
ncbi:MAG TPA: VWA domain-containing protein, partial [Ruminococcus sp.]|nr:VWA domain-containing protein [Ruminococcus sp.]